MQTVVFLNGSDDPQPRYLTWSPIPAQVGFSDPGGATAPVPIKLRNRQPAQGGQVTFYATRPGPTDLGVDELALSLPPNGDVVEFFVSGKFGFPSSEDQDAAIEVVDANGIVLSSTPLMVRVRKNANTLTANERDRFLSAMAQLNAQGAGSFRMLREMHFGRGLSFAHFGPHFLPWHRAFLLDLERRLQAIIPSVTIPYWKFHEPASRIFSGDFMGTSDPRGRVQFRAGHPLESWVTDSVTGIVRMTIFDTQTEPAGTVAGQGAGVGFELVPVRSDDLTMTAFGANHADFVSVDPVPTGGFRVRWQGFLQLEDSEHGQAHNSVVRGFLRALPNAARDPIFFLLHANVDRLWARWQRRNGGRFDASDTRAYPDFAPVPVPLRLLGQLVDHTMWPWDGVTDPNNVVRPQTAPGGGLPASPLASAPGNAPTVRSMFDWQGVLNPASRLGFDYDTVPYGQTNLVGGIL